jgi:uroporphyrinogen-III synthase
MHLLVTRPEPDALRLRAALEERGHGATVEPLHSVSFEDAEPIDLDGVQALIATSRNGLAALAADPALVLARGLPLFAVGKATAAKARAMGFETVVTGAGTAAELAQHIVSVVEPSEGLLLHLAGERLTGDIQADLEAHGFRVLQPVVYRMVDATRLSAVALDRLNDGDIDGVVLMSPASAAIYAALMAKHGLVAVARRLTHFCLSEAVARRLRPLGAVKCEVADAPRLEEVLALIDETAAQSDG